LKAAERDMQRVYDALENDLQGREFVRGPLSIADLALLPHFIGVKVLKVEFSP
jgi:glutathione S-transferase